MVIIEIGAGYCIGRIKYAGQSVPWTLIRINPRVAEGSKATLSMPMSALAALLSIDQMLETIP